MAHCAKGVVSQVCWPRVTLRDGLALLTVCICRSGNDKATEYVYVGPALKMSHGPAGFKCVPEPACAVKTPQNKACLTELMQGFMHIRLHLGDRPCSTPAMFISVDLHF